MNWVDFDGIVIDVDEILYLKRGRWDEKRGTSRATLVYKDGRELELEKSYVEILINLKKVSKKEPGYVD